MELCRTRYFYSHVCRVAVVEGDCCVENVDFFAVTIAFLYEFTVLRGINVRYLTIILVPCWLNGFPPMKTFQPTRNKYTSEIFMPRNTVNSYKNAIVTAKKSTFSTQQSPSTTATRQTCE